VQAAANWRRIRIRSRRERRSRGRGGGCNFSCSSTLLSGLLIGFSRLSGSKLPWRWWLCGGALWFTLHKSGNKNNNCTGQKQFLSN